MIKFKAVGDTTAEKTLAVVRETNAIVKRIDGRSVRRGQRAQARDLQEACYRYWEIGSEKVAVKNATNGKVRYEDVYTYFRRELEELGVETSEEFSRILLRRLKRLSKKAQSK